MKNGMYGLLAALLISLSACQSNHVEIAKFEKINWNNEVIYQVMPRSFYDSNGDLHGDLNGFVQKLDYLQELGVTTILFTPLYESDFYHNYFPTNYKNIDPEYGTMNDYLNFVKEVHKRGMKFLMDMETQYAQSGNIWFDDSYKNPKSEYADFIYYSDSLNQYPEQIFMKPNSPLKDFNLWPGKKRNIVLLDLNHPRVKDYMMDFYTFWVDPNKDGNFDDGVDGFRIDHIMDDLDYKGIFTNMYQDFWKPIFAECKAINPSIFVLGEQSNWNHYGEEMVAKSGADAAFSFPLRFALAGEEGVHDMYSDPNEKGVTMTPSRIHKEVQEAMKRFNDTIFTVNFLENHDTDRWASVVNNNLGQMRIGAVLNLLLPGVPSIYYGQELGLTGAKVEYGSDANHIPVREAFPWTATISDAGNALWYKESGPWWDKSIWKTDKIEKLSVTSQQKDEKSLWKLYQGLIKLRKSNDAFRLGSYKPILEDEDGILAFQREFEGKKMTVIVNSTDETKTLNSVKSTKILMKEGLTRNKETDQLAPYGFVILKD
ncbi:MAG: hypothetical protein CMB99_09595 [Flavobacteriaceae bacterium]|nr:hypothetical protein [Flavobacteriaceae bacterium]|tara:strand:+ start:413419 stop:415044 length:1626 start_codon:yes stop_codon:yes gene_type:complete